MLSTTESVASPKKANPKAPKAAFAITHHNVALQREGGREGGRAGGREGGRMRARE